MPNPNGNRKRCRKCHKLAAKDGWCKQHRPAWEKNNSPYVHRDNFIDDYRCFGRRNRTEFEVIRDKYPIETKEVF